MPKLLPLLFRGMTDARIETAIKRAPADLRAVIERRQGCHHWAGEEPYDKDPAREIADAMRALRCDRLDRDIFVLRRKYKGQATFVALLDRTAEWGY